MTIFPTMTPEGLGNKELIHIGWLVWGAGGLLHQLCSDSNPNDKRPYGSATATTLRLMITCCG